MATPTVLALVVAVVATLIVIGVVAWSAFRRVRRAVDSVSTAFDRLGPALERFQRESAVTSREVERVADALEQLGSDRRRRRERSLDRRTDPAGQPVD